MKNKTLNITITIALILIIGIAIVVSKGTTPEKIKIGFVGPLTGDAAPYGIPVKEGIELALKESINKGLIKDGQIELVFEDGKCDSKEAVTALQKLINVDKVKIVFGGQCSGETLAMAPIAEENKVLLLSSFSTSPDVTNAGDYTFRVPPSDANSGKIVANTIKNDGFKKIGLISESTIAAQTIVPVFTEESNKIGLEIVYKEEFTTDKSDFNTIATKIKETNPEALYVNVQTGASGSKLIKQIRTLGYTGSIYTFFITGDDFVKSGPWVNGVKIIDMKAVTNKDALEKFLTIFEYSFGKKPAYPLGATLGYDAGKIMFEAIAKVGSNPENIKKYLYDMKPLASLTGNLSFDKNGDAIGNDLYYVRTVKDNVLVD